MSRRAILLAGSAVALSAGGVAIAADVYGSDDRPHPKPVPDPLTPLPDIAGGPTISGTFTSVARLDRPVSWTIAYPPGYQRASASRPKLPVAVVLHGRHGDHAYAFGKLLGLDRYLALAMQQGTAPFALASVDGGDTYWHRRTTGEDAGEMVLEEFLPLLGSHGLDLSRVGFLGWSMGGYGSLLLASKLAERDGSARVAAVAAESPAVWRTLAESYPVAFDGPADFAENGIYHRLLALKGIPIRIDCGRQDALYPVAYEFARALTPAPAGGYERGGHDLGYWRRTAPGQLAFIGAHFATAR
ncbi:alpha/beta hydrolase [Jatrophihabitans sp. DSM 45814]